MNHVEGKPAPVEEAAIVDELSKEAATEEKQSEEETYTEVILAEGAAVPTGAAEEIPVDISQVEEGAPDEKPADEGPQTTIPKTAQRRTKRR